MLASPFRPLLSCRLLPLSKRFSSTVPDAREKRVGLVGMGHVGKSMIEIDSCFTVFTSLFNLRDICSGTAVTNNLLRGGFRVTAITDIKPELCQGFPQDVKVPPPFSLSCFGLIHLRVSWNSSVSPLQLLRVSLISSAGN